jgi:hypothetical protein
VKRDARKPCSQVARKRRDGAMNRRNPNVGQQNDAAGQRIRELTSAFRGRSAGYPEALYSFLESRGVEVASSVLVSVSTAEQGVNPICGLLLTQDRRFMEFDLDCIVDGREVTEVHAWTDETAAQNTESQNAGFGKGMGRIALEVQERSAGPRTGDEEVEVGHKF